MMRLRFPVTVIIVYCGSLATGDQTSKGLAGCWLDGMNITHNCYYLCK